jgi:hypothetical protein
MSQKTMFQNGNFQFCPQEFLGRTPTQEAETIYGHYPFPRFPVPENESTQKSKKSVSKVRGISKSSSKDNLMHEAMSQ